MNIVKDLFFKDKEAAEAYSSASQSGYSSNELNVIMSQKTREKYYGKNTTLETEVGSKVAEGGAIGVVVGGAIGAIAAIFAAVGSVIVIPELGLVIAGPLVAALAGAGAGGVTLGVVGALIGLGVQEDRLVKYKSGLRKSSIVTRANPKSAEIERRYVSEWSKITGSINS